MADNQPLKILSLDGGGVRGVATLYLLRGLMRQIALSTNQTPESLRPCDYFDLIAGTSTGGLIAILLGRLRYTVDQAIEKYIALSKDIFSALSNEADARFDHHILEDRIKQVVTEAPCPRPNTLTADEVLKDETFEIPHNQRISNGEPVAGCRVFVVCTIPRGSGSRPEILRSYKTSYDFPFAGKIWQAARATSAAPTFFAPITVDHVTYGDGGTGWNNPTRLVISEVRQIWPHRPIGCLISLGTGEEDANQLVSANSLPKKGFRKKIFTSAMPKSSFKLEVAKYCAKCLTSCNRTHDDIQDNLERDHLVDSYFRLNTPGVGKIGLEEWKQTNDMVDLTVDYLNAPEMKRTKVKIASRILSCHTPLVVMNIPVQPELGNPDSPQRLPIRLLHSPEPQEMPDDHKVHPSAAVMNTRSDSSSRPVAHLLSFTAYCSLLAKRFDAIKHIAPSLHRLNINVMGLTYSLRQLCYNILIQVPSTTLFTNLSQIEGLPHPDIEIPLLPLLQKDLQTRIDFFSLVSEIRKGLMDMETELDKLRDLIAQQGIEGDSRQIEALVRSYEFDRIQAKLKISQSCFRQLPAKLREFFFEKDKVSSRSTFVEGACPMKASNEDPLLLDPSVARCRVVRGLSSEVYRALAKVCGDHACHSAQFQLRPHHAVERGTQTYVDFQLRFSGDIATLSSSEAALCSIWLSIKSRCKESRRETHKVSKRRHLATKRKLAVTLDGYGEAGSSRNKRVKQQTPKETPQDGTRSSGTDHDSNSFASANSTKGIDFSARTNFCSRVMAYNQSQCLDPHRYLGFFRVETSTEHQVFFSDAYQKLGHCHSTSLYDVLTTMVPIPNRNSFQYERVELAKQLASAMLQFQNSPLLRHYWGGDDIIFFRQPESAGNVRSILSAPYLNVQIKGTSAQASLLDLDDDDAFEEDTSESFVKNEYLFRLATTLIEIAYQTEMEDLLSAEEGRLCEDDPELELWYVAERLCNDISSNLGSQYRAVVRFCLELSLKDDHLVRTDEYENTICKEVVNELEELKISMVDELFG